MQNNQENISLQRAKKGILTVVLLGIVTVGVIIALTFNQRTLLALSRVNLTFLGLAVLGIFLSWVFSGLPFYLLTRVIKKPIGFIASLRVYLGGTFFGYITPFGSGLIPTQVYILTADGLTPGEATAVTSSRATISSWLFVVLGLMIFIVFRSSLPGSVKLSLLGIAAAAAIWSLITLFFIKQPARAKASVSRILQGRILVRWFGEERLGKARDRIHHEIDNLSLNLKDLFSLKNAPSIIAVFLSEVVAWFGLFSVLPLVLFGFGVSGNLGQLVFRIFLLFAVAPVSPTPGGSGVVEAALTGILQGLVPSEIIGLIVLVWRFLTYYLTLLIGAAFVLRFISKTSSTKPSKAQTPQQSNR
ncbi:MAG: lysylphosphatidylglycerol synthase transmembrane domain-containing protein [Candidatus Aquicultor sp.]